MDESFSTSLDVLPEAESQEARAIIDEVQRLDPELLEDPETRKLVYMGAEFMNEITEEFGKPDKPKWASCTYESDVFMSFHNGGEDGHTSVGKHGLGVPRAVLLIAKKVNDTAEREVFDPMMRATAFYAAAAHDSRQLCGRSLLPEGQGQDRGDERLSAEAARQRYLDAGGDPAVGLQIYQNIMATAYNPETSQQYVDHFTWRQRPDDPELTREVLGQELTAAADLLSPTSQFATINAIRYNVEFMGLYKNNRHLQHRLHEIHQDPRDITTMGRMLNVIGQDKELRQNFVTLMDGQAAFFRDHLKYSDEAIRAQCGQGIDDLFPGRLQNADRLDELARLIHTGVSPLQVWQQEQHKAALLT